MSHICFKKILLCFCFGSTYFCDNENIEGATIKPKEGSEKKRDFSYSCEEKDGCSYFDINGIIEKDNENEIIEFVKKNKTKYNMLSFNSKVNEDFILSLLDLFKPGELIVDLGPNEFTRRLLLLDKKIDNAGLLPIERRFMFLYNKKMYIEKKI